MRAARTAGSRDVRIDFARGLCLWFIFIDHMASSFFSTMTPKNVLVCDAADVFVFLSGISATLAYASRFDRSGWRDAAGAILHRVRTIYWAHVALLVAVLLICTMGYKVGIGEFAAAFEVDITDVNLEKLLRLALMLDRPWFADILPLYIVLLMCYAAVLPMIRTPILLLAASGVLWANAYVTHMSHATLQGFIVLFNPLAWQFLFVLGIVGVRASHLLHRVPARPVDGLACCILLAGVLAHALLPPPNPADPWEVYDHLWWPVRYLIRGANKADLDPGRVLSLLSLAWLASRHVRRDASWLGARWARAFIALGRRSLPVFTVGIVLSGLGEAALRRTGDVGVDVAVNVIGFLGLVATARLFDAERGCRAWLTPREQRVP